MLTGGRWSRASALLAIYSLVYQILAGGYWLQACSPGRVYFTWRLSSFGHWGKNWPAPTEQQLILESNSETQPVGDIMCSMDSGTMCQVLEPWKLGLDDLRVSAHTLTPALGKNSLPARNSSRADTHTPFRGWAGAGLAGQILAGSHFSAFDQTQALVLGPESLPGRDISKERARALERLVGESVRDCDLYFFPRSWGL